ncbi:hypothetical protein FOL47_005484 [Perkinsus chesapeaki]|uniref:Uncharacterized protein n=1 Tax=Perkinsus chesapeaki TaxID=330153 RepID=A0A7J6LXI1_PERCH|nr:hypothetical protein FOL47_005484 [Perkinsus chesapeaki]
MLHRVVSVALVGLVYSTDWNYCQELCEQTEGCPNYKWGSYCKGNGVCFGLLQLTEDQYCFEPTDMYYSFDCNDQVLDPVPCPVVDKTCSDLCDETPKCKNSKYGSYCKSYVNQPGPYVCFGLYHSDGPHLCFQPVDGDCDGTPVLCPSQVD